MACTRANAEALIAPSSDSALAYAHRFVVGEATGYAATRAACRTCATSCNINALAFFAALAATGAPDETAAATAIVVGLREEHKLVRQGCVGGLELENAGVEPPNGCALMALCVRLPGTGNVNAVHWYVTVREPSSKDLLLVQSADWAEDGECVPLHGVDVPVDTYTAAATAVTARSEDDDSVLARITGYMKLYGNVPIDLAAPIAHTGAAWFIVVVAHR